MTNLWCSDREGEDQTEVPHQFIAVGYYGPHGDEKLAKIASPAKISPRLVSNGRAKRRKPRHLEFALLSFEPGLCWPRERRAR